MFGKQEFLKDYFYLEECLSSEGWRFNDNTSYCGLSSEAKRNLFWIQFKIGHHWLIVSGNKNSNIVEAFKPELCCNNPGLDFRRGCDNCGVGGRTLAGPVKLIRRNANGFSYDWLDLDTAVSRLSPLLALDSLEAIPATEELLRFMNIHFALESPLAAI